MPGVTCNSSANSVAIFENKVVDKIGYPRAVYTDNGSHFKRLFTEHLRDKGVRQFFAPITSPSPFGLPDRSRSLFQGQLSIPCEQTCQVCWQLYAASPRKMRLTTRCIHAGRAPCTINRFGFCLDDELRFAGHIWDEVTSPLTIHSLMPYFNWALELWRAALAIYRSLCSTREEGYRGKLMTALAEIISRAADVVIDGHTSGCHWTSPHLAAIRPSLYSNA